MRRGDFRLTAQRAQPEGLIQQRIVAMLRAYLPDEVWWTASLSGVPLSPAAAKRAKAHGMQKGAPDLSFVFPDGVTKYIEVKSQTGILTPEQRALQVTLGTHRFAVARSWEDAKEILTAWLAEHGLRFLTDAESVRRRAA